MIELHITTFSLQVINFIHMKFPSLLPTNPVMCPLKEVTLLL